MAGLAKRFMKTTTTTTSASSSRIIGGEEEDGVVEVDDGGGMFFRGGGKVPSDARSKRFESTASTGDDGDVEDLMEPDLSDTRHMKFVDGRCSCCPYGYHVDLDFLQYLESLNNGEYLNSLKKIHHNKEQLRRSYESYLEQQAAIEKENRAVTRAVDQIDRGIEGQLAAYDPSLTPGGSRRILSDETNRTTDVTYDRKYTETIELRKAHHHHHHLRNHEPESGSSVSISSGPSSPTGPSYLSPHGMESHAPPPGGRGFSETTVSTSMTVLPKQKRLLELEQQLMDIKPIPPTDHFQHTYFNSAGEFGPTTGGRRPGEGDRNQVTPTNENVNGVYRPGRDQHEPDRYDGTNGRHGGIGVRLGGSDMTRGETDKIHGETDMMHGGTEISCDRTQVSLHGREVRLDGGEVRYDHGELGTDRGESPEMARISQATLQAIREQMAASLQRMHELEEQVKAIPVLQVRNSVLKEEKRMLELQLQSKADHMRSIGVGDFTVDESDFDERSEYSYRRYLQAGSEDDRHRMIGSRADTDGTDGDGVFRSTTTVSLGYGIDGDVIPVRVHEKELKTEENTEIKEKEVKTVFLGGGDDVLTTDLTDDRFGRVPKTFGKLLKKDVRSIGVGEGNVFDGSSGVEVHQKELRTVYIGDAGKQHKSTRNVGILCKPAMRDVGMVHMTDSERPMVRTIAVGVGEVGVAVGGDGGFYSGDEGPEGVGGMQTMNAAMSQMTISSYQSRFHGLKNDQLRSMLDEMLKRTVHSVAVQCNFNTEDKAIDAARVGYEMVEVACSDDVIDVEVKPICQMKSVAIDNRPSLFHRACGTDTVYKIDMATNTQALTNRHHQATNTESKVTYPAATNTDAPVRTNTAVETEKSVFFALQQIANTGTNTNIQEFWDVGLNTDLSGDVQELVIKPEQKDFSVNTLTSSVKVWDKTTSTTPSQCSEKAVNTTGTQKFERGINTEKLRTSAASVNTDRTAFVSRGIDCNIIQPEKKAPTSSFDEGFQTSRSLETNRTVQTTTSEAIGPVEHRNVRTTITRQREIAPSVEGLQSTDSRMGDDNQEFEEVTVGGSGGRTTTTRIVKTTRGGRPDTSVDFPTGDLGFQSLDTSLGGSVGSSTTTRTVTKVTRGGKADVTDEFPETRSGFLDSVSEQIGETEAQSSSRTTLTTAERPEFEDGFGLESSGGRGTITRTVTTVTRGGRSGLREDFPVGKVGFQRFGREEPEFNESFDTVSTGVGGGGMISTRTVRTVTRGGRSELTDDFPMSKVSFRDDDEESLGGGNAERSGSRTVTRTVRRSYRTGGSEQPDLASSHSLMSNSGAMTQAFGAEEESQLLRKMDEDFSRMQHGREFSSGSSGGRGGCSSSRTIIKRSSGDPNDPESWHKETWVTEGDGSTSRQIITGSGEVEIPETSESRVQHHVSGQMCSLSGLSTTNEPLRSIMKTRQTERSSDFSTSRRKGISFSESAANKYEVSQELESAFNIYDQWLEDSTRVTAKQLNSSLAAIQKEWFKVSSHKSSSSSQVEGFLNITYKLSPDLLKQIINMADANGNSALHYAVSNCNLEVVNLLLDLDICDINHQNKTGCTAIMMAALTDIKTERHQEIIQKLFQMGDINIQAPNREDGGSELAGQTALMLAVSHGRLDMVKMLLDADANVNLQDEDGSTALMVAAEHGHVDITRLLLSHPNCDALITDKDGSTALSIAKEEGRQSIVSLINAHLDVKSSKPESRSASLHKARKVVTRITLSSPTEMS